MLTYRKNMYITILRKDQDISIDDLADFVHWLTSNRYGAVIERM
jgi:hypothetical protein